MGRIAPADAIDDILARLRAEPTETIYLPDSAPPVLSLSGATVVLKTGRAVTVPLSVAELILAEHLADVRARLRAAARPAAIVDNLAIVRRQRQAGERVPPGDFEIPIRP